MKTFRLCLLLLIAVLLPVRGALAVAMQCSGPGPLVQAEAQVLEAGHDHHEAAAAGAGHGHPQDGAAHDHSAHGETDTAGHEHAGTTDKCNFCAASCSGAALVSTSLGVADPLPVSTAFPRLHAPAPSFVSDGQERPPRST